MPYGSAAPRCLSPHFSSVSVALYLTSPLRKEKVRTRRDVRYCLNESVPWAENDLIMRTGRVELQLDPELVKLLWIGLNCMAMA